MYHTRLITITSLLTVQLKTSLLTGLTLFTILGLNHNITFPISTTLVACPLSLTNFSIVDSVYSTILQDQSLILLFFLKV